MQIIRSGAITLAGLSALWCRPASAETCVPTGFVLDGSDLTAARINPASVTGEVDATGCDIGVFYDAGGGVVFEADIHGAGYFGVAVVAQARNIRVDVMDSNIHEIGERPFKGARRGVAIYYRAFRAPATAWGTITNNTISDYQQGGIALHGPGSNARIVENLVAGQGRVANVAQNGIQVSFGARAHIEGNEVTGHEYSGTSTVSTGIFVVGGGAYGPCPTVDGHCPYTTQTRILKNLVASNDVGIFVSNLDAGFRRPVFATKVQVVGNEIAKDDGFTSGLQYQAGIAVAGACDKIIDNVIRGSGYQTPAFTIDAHPSFALSTRLRANLTP